MIDYDISNTTLYSAEAFNKLMKSIGAENKFQKLDPQEVWLTTSEVYNALSAEITIQNDNFIVVPQYMLPKETHTVLFSDNLHAPNRAERRKKQKEERRSKKNGTKKISRTI